MSADHGGSQERSETQFPWAGPALFVCVLAAILAFFFWFLKA